MRSPDQLAELIRTRFHGRKVVVVSNREPIVHQRRGDRIEVQHPASGLTTAMTPIVEACGGTWIAHGSGSADFDVTDAQGCLGWPPSEPTYRLRRVALSAELEKGYYYGLANEGLWPLCHIAYTAPIFRHRDWEAYREANQLFARAVLDEIGDQRAVVFVNDYHFALLPRMLRDVRPDLLIAHFWHIPWPNREVMRVMPWGEEFLHGLLGNDLLGFHIKHHCNNFLDTVDRGVEGRVDYEHDRVIRGGHSTYVRPFPISIDLEGFSETSQGATFADTFPELAARTVGQTLLLGVDRLDYTKGVPHRLRIVESILERWPERRGKLAFVQVGAPTRSAIGRYRALAEEVEELVAEINGRYAYDGWQPIHYLSEHHDRDRLAVLFRRADACLVTSLHDGMNLVAKEYIAAQQDGEGVLLLSKYTGAARELPEACLINPYDIEGSAELLEQALRLPSPVRREAMSRLRARIHQHDVYDWAAQLFSSLADVSARGEAAAFPGN
ncbi:MAG: trehalose-6-phosphate synthase [Myxococcales bacterium]|nr:MAG: trehalose-6-phosphate synthase [Myxococcales bacterium]